MLAVARTPIARYVRICVSPVSGTVVIIDMGSPRIKRQPGTNIKGIIHKPICNGTGVGCELLVSVSRVDKVRE